jgi:hypothetical protein
MCRSLRLDPEALIASRESIKATVEFGTIMAWFYVADRSSAFIPSEKVWAPQNTPERRFGLAAAF